MNTDAAGNHASGQRCPCCSAAVFRVSRRLIDLLVSVFVPVRRYRCRSMKCGWEGNLRDQRPHSWARARDQKYEDSNYHLLESSRMGRGAPPVKPSK